jgi:hypothetical protein
MEEYQHPDLLDEEAIRRAIEESELIELGHWDGLGAQLRASAAPPPPRPLAPEPQVGWGHTI